MKKIPLVLMALLATALAAPVATVAAPSQIDNDRITVSYADLNIHNEAGAKALYARLQNASKAACDYAPYRELGSLERAQKVATCYADTLDEFVSKIDSAALKKIHAG